VTETKINIRDADGNVVCTLNVNNFKKGENKVSWNGMTE
jgi:flagellar hook assembly protein FlgD